MAKCEKCGDTGKVFCTACRGTMQCQHCEGRGWKPRLTFSKDYKEECSYCGGRGLCPVCNGKPIQKCDCQKNCFITTAVCDFNNKPDDCSELNILRWFRDNWLINQHDGKEIIEEYYRIAPKIVEKINNNKNCETIYRNIENAYIKKCIKHIEQKEYLAAKTLYIEMVNHLVKLMKIF